MTAQTGGSQTVDRALIVLQIIAAEPRPILLEEIAVRAGLHKSIVYRLVRSLESAGFVGRHPSLGGYTTAATFLSLSLRTVTRIDLRQKLRPIMEKIVSQFGETTSLHIRSGDSRVCVQVIEGTHAIRRAVPVGEMVPIHAGETGRALLSAIPEVEREPLIAQAETEGIDGTALRHDLRKTQQQGFFIGIGVRTPGVGSLSFPISGSIDVLAALTISGPVSRWSRAAMSAAAPTILDMLGSVERELGLSA